MVPARWWQGNKSVEESWFRQIDQASDKIHGERDLRLLIAIVHRNEFPHDRNREAQESTWLNADAQELYAEHGIRVVYASSRFTNPIQRRMSEAGERLRWSRLGGRGDRGLYSEALHRVLMPFSRWTPNVTRTPTTPTETWEVDCPPFFSLTLWRLKSVMNHFLQDGHDYIYFTTDSAYVFPLRLMRWIEKNPSAVAAGTIMGSIRRNKPFLSGANRLFSRATVEHLVRDFASVPKGYLEDVSIGEWLTSTGIILSALETVNVAGHDELQDFVHSGQFATTHHVRLKSFVRGQRIDPELMRVLHETVER